MTDSLWRKRQEPERSMKVEGPLHVVCQCDKCKPQISFNAEVIGYIEPQRKPLTDEEIQKIWDVAAGAIPGWSRHIAYARAIEAAHGIKE